MSEAKKLVSISDLARSYGLDTTHIAKLVKKHKLETISAISKEGKACKALSDKEIAKLEKAEPMLTAKEFNEERYITLDNIAEEMDLDSSNLHKAIRNAGFEFTYLRVPTERTRTIKREGVKAIKETVVCSGKAKPCLTKAEFAKFKASHSKVRLG